MTLLYACNVLVAIIAESEKGRTEGLTKEEILKINQRCYKADFDRNWGTAIFLELNDSVTKREDRCLLRPEFDYDPNWKKLRGLE
ncbi:MAG: hypothetical protein NTX24_00915 [Candidatus Pacearchaeota archaeon]|nr:hypothetical protein [Candidatus Pacearchaeota archaeon]